MRGRRLAAKLIDAFLVIAPDAVIGMDGTPEALKVLLGVAVLGLLAAQAYLLTRRGQSLGKIALGLRIVRAGDGSNPGFVRAVLLRTMINGLCWIFFPYFLVDALMIFRKDERCAHDHLADTRVVAA
jgi:uncharacterized RDD family membrane protein YckC